uniref:Uncharacterized protein n=1 Tax=Anguilla anguilla TaxID=7936 RepID=A0A0E9Q329_ANGAN
MANMTFLSCIQSAVCMVYFVLL